MAPQRHALTFSFSHHMQTVHYRTQNVTFITEALELSYIFHDMHLNSSVGMCEKASHTAQLMLSLIKERLIIECGSHERVIFCSHVK